MIISRLTPDEHAILYYELAKKVYRTHQNIKPKEVDKLVQLELHSMNLTEAEELISDIEQKTKLKYCKDELIIQDE